MTKKFLIVGHDAGRTGAPILLLHFLRWLSENRPDISFDIMLIEGGPLANEYREISETTVLSESRTIFDKILDKARRIINPLAMNRLPRVPILNRDYAVVLGNTVVSLPVLEHFSNKRTTTICWVHEMEYVVRRFYTESRFSDLMNSIDRIILPSNALHLMLDDFTIRTPAAVVYEPLPSAAGSVHCREALGIPAEAFVVLGCGQIGWRKGVDIFLDIAEQIVSKAENVYFIWVGGYPERPDQFAANIKQRAAELRSDRIILAGERADARPFFASADLLALTSREDPFPLVTLEAADHSLPVICFANAGGAPEFVGADAGRVVAFDDVDAFEAAILQLRQDRTELKRLGRNAKSKFEGPFSIDTNAAKVLNVLEEEALKRDGR